MRMMVAVDLRKEANEVIERALPWAARLTGTIHLRAVSALNSDAIHVFGDTSTQAVAQEWERWCEMEKAELQGLLEGIPEPMRGTTDLLQGAPGGALVEAAGDFDLVVVGTHGRKGIARAFLGSVAERVVRHATVPVLVVPLASTPIPASGPLRVVLPVEARLPQLAAARQVAAWLGKDAELHVVHALEDVHLSPDAGMSQEPVATADAHPHRAWADHRIKKALEESGLTGTLHFVLATGGNPAVDLADFVHAHGAELVALPSHGRKGWSRVAFGSVTERMVRLVGASCLVVR